MRWASLLSCFPSLFQYFLFSFLSDLFCFVCLFFYSLLEPFYINEYITIAPFYKIINYHSIDKIYIKNFLGRISVDVIFHSFSGSGFRNQSFVRLTTALQATWVYTNQTLLFLLSLSLQLFTESFGLNRVLFYSWSLQASNSKFVSFCFNLFWLFVYLLVCCLCFSGFFSVK